MVTSTTFMQVKAKVDELAQINDIIKCFDNAQTVGLGFKYLEGPDATFRMDEAMRDAVKEKYEEVSEGIWEEIKELVQGDE